MARRDFLAQLAGLPFLAGFPLLAFGPQTEPTKKPLKIMMKSAWGRMVRLAQHLLLSTALL